MVVLLLLLLLHGLPVDVVGVRVDRDLRTLGTARGASAVDCGRTGTRLPVTQVSFEPPPCELLTTSSPRQSSISSSAPGSSSRPASVVRRAHLHASGRAEEVPTLDELDPMVRASSECSKYALLNTPEVRTTTVGSSIPWGAAAVRAASRRRG